MANKLKAKRKSRPDVVSFRITTQQSKAMNELFNSSEATGVNSANQFARKVVCDYIAGRVVYPNPSDKLQDFDTVGN